MAGEGDPPQWRQLRLRTTAGQGPTAGDYEPELTGEWNIPVAWELQAAFKAHCLLVELNVFECLWYLCLFCGAS